MAREGPRHRQDRATASGDRALVAPGAATRAAGTRAGAAQGHCRGIGGDADGTENLAVLVHPPRGLAQGRGDGVDPPEDVTRGNELLDGKACTLSLGRPRWLSPSIANGFM